MDRIIGITDDKNDPELGHGIDNEPIPQHSKYLVLNESEIHKGFVRPVFDSYMHKTCGTVTRMSRQIAETYAAKPSFYGATYCVHCQMHRAVGEHGEFFWIADNGAVTDILVGT